jgi:hypothetical protein
MAAICLFTDRGSMRTLRADMVDSRYDTINGFQIGVIGLAWLRSPSCSRSPRYSPCSVRISVMAA